MRVYELAKELKISHQELLKKLKELGHSITSQHSILDDSLANKIRELYQKSSPPPQVKEDRISSTVVRRRSVSTPPPQPTPTSRTEKLEEKTDLKEIQEGKETPSLLKEDKTKEEKPIEKKSSFQETAEKTEELHSSQPQKGTTSPSVKPPASPPALQEETVSKPSEEGESTEGKKPKRVVGKRLYRPSRTEEQSLAKILMLREKGKRKEDSEPSTLPQKVEKRKIKIENTITVGELAKAMGIKSADIIKKFIEMGMPVTINQPLDAETAGIIATDYGFEVEEVGFHEEEWLTSPAPTDPSSLLPRQPVVTIMGHVDHGKTTLLDTIRKTKVAEGEAGGITQHIGAYEVTIPKGTITFIDTPGHEAFTALRARGASVTDIVILVVSATDGVMPQTLEAIQHAREAKTPIIVAINKMDLPEAQPEKVKQQLAEHGLIPEEWGGDTITIPISAKTGMGVDKLLESILLVAEILDLKANPKARGMGTVIESKLDKGKGPSATIIVQNGTLHKGDYVVCGTTWGKVRLLLDHLGKAVDSAKPGKPVEVLGLEELPPSGEKIYVVENEKIAQEIAERRSRKVRLLEMQKNSKLRMETAFQKMQEGKIQELPILIKADVQGSLDAILHAINAFSQEGKEVRLRIVHSGVGAITENDVNLAQASGGIIIGFNTRPDSKASKAAGEFGVEIKVYTIIYQLLDELKKALEGLLRPEEKEVSLGWAKVLQIFPIKGVGVVAGSQVIHGKFVRGEKVRLVRNGQVLYDGVIANLRRYKTDVNEVLEGQECGILLENFNKVEIGDELECYQIQKIPRTLQKVGL